MRGLRKWRSGRRGSGEGEGEGGDDNGKWKWKIGGVDGE